MSAFSPVPSGPHSSEDASTGTTDIETIAAPAHARAMMISVKTTAARVTFDGTDPDPSILNGLVFPAGLAPALIPFIPNGGSLKYCSDTAGTSELDVLWLTY